MTTRRRLWHQIGSQTSPLTRGSTRRRRRRPATTSLYRAAYGRSGFRRVAAPRDRWLPECRRRAQVNPPGQRACVAVELHGHASSADGSPSSACDRPAARSSTSSPLAASRRAASAHHAERQLRALGDVEQRVPAIGEIEDPQERHALRRPVLVAAERGSRGRAGRAAARIWAMVLRGRQSCSRMSISAAIIR